VLTVFLKPFYKLNQGRHMNNTFRTEIQPEEPNNSDKFYNIFTIINTTTSLTTVGQMLRPRKKVQDAKIRNSLMCIFLSPFLI